MIWWPIWWRSSSWSSSSSQLRASSYPLQPNTLLMHSLQLQCLPFLPLHDPARYESTWQADRRFLSFDRSMIIITFTFCHLNSLSGDNLHFHSIWHFASSFNILSSAYMSGSGSPATSSAPTIYQVYILQIQIQIQIQMQIKYKYKVIFREKTNFLLCAPKSVTFLDKFLCSQKFCPD